MRSARAFVEASGNTSMRGFFGSEAVDYDPPSLSLRQNVVKFLARQVYDLADGPSDDVDEEQIRDIMVGTQNCEELVRLFGTIEGWDGLDDELPEGYLDPIAQRLTELLDRRDYVPYQMMRRYIWVLDYDAPPTLGACFEKIRTAWPPAFQPFEIDSILLQKKQLLDSVTRAVMRERDILLGAAAISVTTINNFTPPGIHRGPELVALMHEVNYTVTICRLLANVDFVNLYSVVFNMADATLSAAQRQACHDTFLRLRPEIAATSTAVELVGSGQNKTTVDRFNVTLKAALDNFSTAVPPATIISAIGTTLDTVAGTIADLTKAVADLTGTVLGSITLPKLLGSDGDDKARYMTSELQARGILGHAPMEVKRTAINAALDGFTVDDDEISILRVMRTSKVLCQAELYQLASDATWESLDTSFDGDQYDELVSLLNAPV